MKTTIRYHDPDMPIHLHASAKAAASIRSMSLKDWVREAIKIHIEKGKGRHDK